MYKSLLTGFFALTLSTVSFADESKVDTTEATASPDRLAKLESSLLALQSRVVELEGKLETANSKLASLESGSNTNMTMAGAPSGREAQLEAKVALLEGKLSEVDERTGWAKAPPKTVSLNDPGVGDGSLTVESPNIHGEVWLNGKGTGAFGPVTFKKLGAGTHKVEIKVDGKSVRSANVKVDDKRNRRVVIF